MKRAEVVTVPLSTRLARSRRFAATREVLGEALRASGELAGAPRALAYEAWPHDAAGAPAPQRAWHASWSDTTGLVAALVAPLPVALDVEWRHRPRWQAARERFSESGELARLAPVAAGGNEQEAVLALWTAKEALLKLARTGLADLARCPLVAAARSESEAGRGFRFRLRHAAREFLVPVHALGAHLVAVAAAEPVRVTWHELQEVS